MYSIFCCQLLGTHSVRTLVVYKFTCLQVFSTFHSVSMFVCIVAFGVFCHDFYSSNFSTYITAAQRKPFL